jgi:hypothetical protein
MMNVEDRDFGSHGISLRVLARAQLSVDDLATRYGRAFIVTHGKPPHPVLAPMRTRDDISREHPAEDEVTGELRIVVFPVRQRPSSLHPFVSIGRIDGNDIALADETISKFHAFIIESPDGSFVLQDARSRNGTILENAPVPPRGTGAPVPLVSGQTIRFGGVSTTFLDAPGVLDLARCWPR